MTKQNFEVIDGVYVGPKVWKGNLCFLDYRDTITSLGSLTEVRGSLDLDCCTNLVSLDSLTKVGEWMFSQNCTNLVSLGSLKEVGGDMYLIGGTNSPKGPKYTFQKVQEKIHYYSHLPLHEALNALHTDEVNDVPLFKNILLQILQGD
jgi:hypothetical protein